MNDDDSCFNSPRNQPPGQAGAVIDSGTAAIIQPLAINRDPCNSVARACIDLKLGRCPASAANPVRIKPVAVTVVCRYQFKDVCD